MIADVALRREEVEALCRRFGVRRLDVFGSAARRDFDPARSDVDFLVEFDEATTFRNYFGRKEALEGLFCRSVDLVEAGTIRNPYLTESIAQSRETVFEA